MSKTGSVYLYGSRLFIVCDLTGVNEEYWRSYEANKSKYISFYYILHGNITISIEYD